ncbi:arylsulfatase [Candidatus Sumerlaeota bacterium]|nr:arylsulfatase [Candidatus Sumerlaeota bacterium]
MCAINRREFLSQTGKGALAATLSLALARQASAASLGASAKKPNIIYFMADDLGYAHLGCYGQKLIQTPNADQLAREGTRFTQTYAGCTVCAPSRSVLMTGLHMGHTPVRTNPGGVSIRDEDVTVAEVLKQAGYATGLFGKWGLGDARTPGIPTRQGFDAAFGYLHQVHAHFYYPEYLWHNEEKYPLPGNAGGKKGQYSADVILDKALDFIRSNKDRPFFCYLPTTLPHSELAVPEETLKMYAGKFPEEPFANPRPGYAAPREPKATLAAMITHMDKCFGRVMALLKELGLDENTIVFFTSDNGGPGSYGARGDFFKANGPLRDYKTSMYEGGLRVPMIVRWPGKIKAAATNNNLVWYFADVMPTLADLAGTKPPKGIDGISVLPTLLGEDVVGRKQQTHDFLYWELITGMRLQQAVRMGDWKAVRVKQEAPLEIYNLRDDLGETKNVAAEHPDVVARIEAYLKTCRTEPPPQIEPDKPEGQRWR